MTSAFVEKSFSWSCNTRNEYGEYVKYEDSPCNIVIVDRMVIAQQIDGTYNVDIWSNVPPVTQSDIEQNICYLPDEDILYTDVKEGICYLPSDASENSKVLAKHDSFNFIDIKYADTDFENYKPYIDKIIRCLHLEYKLSEIYSTIQSIVVASKLIKLKKKRHIFTSDHYSRYIEDIQHFCEWQSFIHNDKPLLGNIIKNLSQAIFYIKIAPMIESFEKQNRHVSHSKS